MIIAIVRKPLTQNVCENIALHNTGGINIDGIRISTEDGKPPYEYKNGAGGVYSHDYQKNSSKAKEWNNFSTKEDNLPIVGNSLGRWPANVLLSESVVEVMNDQSGVLRARGNKGCSKGGGGLYGHKETVNNFGFGDDGGASRFFKVLG